jgi:heme-degrading monooxygenase HmoA
LGNGIHREEIAMICALTVRKLKPGTYEQFRDEFMRNFPDSPPEGFTRFDMLRNTEDPDEVISFGFFDGSPEQLREMAAKDGYAEQLERIAPFVDSVGADGLYEIVEERRT